METSNTTTTTLPTPKQHHPNDGVVTRERATRRKRTSGSNATKKIVEPTDDDEVEKKIEALQKIVPGGQTLAVDQLFEETAEYILQLQCQVKALRFLTALVDGSKQLEKRKLGG